MDLACQCQLSSHPTAVISALIITNEVPSPTGCTANWEITFRISRSPDDSYTNDKVSQKVITFPLFNGYTLRRHYWRFLDDPGRCGVLYHERAKCCTRIVNFWLLFLEATPDPEEQSSLDHKRCCKLVLANWSRMLSKCVLGDKNLICRLCDFNLDKACKEDVKRAIAWLKVSPQGRL